MATHVSIARLLNSRVRRNPTKLHPIPTVQQKAAESGLALLGQPNPADELADAGTGLPLLTDLFLPLLQKLKLTVIAR